MNASDSTITATGTNFPAKYLHLVVSDGQLQVQAIFVPPSNTGQNLRLHQGDIIEVRKFRVRKAPRLNGQGSVVYLSVDECKWAGRETKAINEVELEFEGGFIREEIYEKNIDPIPNDAAGASIYSKPSPVRLAVSLDMGYPQRGSLCPTLGEVIEGQSGPEGRHFHRQSNLDEDNAGSDDEEDSFDTFAASPSEIENRREALRQIRQHRSPRTPGHSGLYYYSEVVSDDDDDPSEGSSPPPAEEYGPLSIHINGKDGKSKQTDALTDHNRTVMATRPHSEASSLPVHTLSSLLDSKSTLPRRGYTCSILAVVSWVSPSIIFKPNTPFPPKRHIKVHDQTISHRQAGITVAVFVDAKDFMPATGTVALLRGVVMQTFGDDIILNKYAAHPNFPDTTVDKDPDEKNWFVTDQKKLNELGFDVKSVKTWWDERVKRKV